MKLLTILFTIIIFASCSRGDNQPSERADDTVLAILDDEQKPNPYAQTLGKAPDKDCVKLSFKSLGALPKVFNDSNHVHMAAAERSGFAPMHTQEDILCLDSPLVEIESCPEYYLEGLTDSFAFLAPSGAELLNEIGTNFNQKLRERGGGAYRIRVTSVLRTPYTVKKLMRKNRNASANSVHQYGTTFDISYVKFVCDSHDAPHRSFEDLKGLLAEVLYELRQQGRCFVKYEKKQGCFHITAR